MPGQYVTEGPERRRRELPVTRGGGEGRVRNLRSLRVGHRDPLGQCVDRSAGPGGYFRPSNRGTVLGSRGVKTASVGGEDGRNESAHATGEGHQPWPNPVGRGIVAARLDPLFRAHSPHSDADGLPRPAGAGGGSDPSHAPALSLIHISEPTRRTPISY